MNIINQTPTENVEAKNLETVSNEYYAQLATDLVALEKDERFQRLITTGYFKDRAIKCTEIMATDYVRSKNLRGEVIEELNAISMLQEYFFNIKTLGLAPSEDDVEEIEG